jgi:predicted RNA polymerase sigma factor
LAVSYPPRRPPAPPEQAVNRSTSDGRPEASAVQLVYTSDDALAVEAAIAACHAEAPAFESTDWLQVLALYDLLLSLAPSPVSRLNRALAVWRVAGPQAALRQLDELAGDLDGHHIFHGARGELLAEIGRQEQSRAARLQALALDGQPGGARAPAPAAPHVGDPAPPGRR